MPLKAPPPSPWFDWSGWYAGFNGGYSWGRSSTSYDGTGAGFAAFSTTQDMDGWLGGVQIGYNRQFNRNWLFGVEADIQGTGQDGAAGFPTIVIPPIVGIAAAPGATTVGGLSQKLPWFGTARLRLGYEPSDHWLLYVTGGLAFGEVESDVGITTTTTTGVVTTATPSASDTRLGWTIGGGAEWWLADRWTAKVEYLYMDLGTFSDTFAGTGSITTLAISSHVTDNIFRVGVNYHLDGPIAARY